MKKINLLYAMALVSLASCKNNDWEFPDFEFQSVYFAYQTPIRTVTLGEDIFDNSLDNQHKVKVMATTGGVYNNGKDIRRAIVSDWDVAPKDFIFYALKYINPWHGNYLRRGTDQIVGKGANNSLTKNIVRHQAYVEKDEVKSVTTAALKKSILPLSFKGTDDVNINVNLNLSFDDDNNCSVSSASAGVAATGSGKFVKRGEKNSWGNTDRDALYLSYTIDMAQMTVTSKDTLVMRDRSVKMETFTPVKK